MASVSLEQVVSAAGRAKQASGIRPATLLVAFGIALITVILMVTGVALNQLRQQALETAQGELGRIDTVLAEAGDRSLRQVDAQLAEIAERVEARLKAANLREAAQMPEVGAVLDAKLGRFPAIDALALVDTKGEAVAHSTGWPAPAALADMLAGMAAQPSRDGTIGAPVDNPRTGTVSIPLAHRVSGPNGELAGAVVAMMPANNFASLFAAVPLAPDAVIELLRQDGTTLVRYPEQNRATGDAANKTGLDAVFGDPNQTMVRQATSNSGEWRVEALRALPGYPVAVTVSRSAEKVLGDWTRQGTWFGAFALVIALAIATVVWLIARQFQTHATLAAMRAERIEAEKIEIERARLAAEAELLKAERLSVLGQLTATVAHELRNPLSAIRNTLFTVKEMAANSGLKLDRPIGRMERSIERCDRIISDLLEYTRTRELSRSRVTVDRWLGDILSEQNLPPAVLLGTELGAPGATASLDADRVRRVVINLVENAAQALGELPPDREKRITVRTAPAAGQLVLTVEDNGPGITPENLARIFEPLFSTKSFGTGLGLPTVKQIVNQHGGTIEVESEVGQGTRVTVRLPLEAEPAAVEDVKVAA